MFAVQLRGNLQFKDERRSSPLLPTQPPRRRSMRQQRIFVDVMRERFQKKTKTCFALSLGFILCIVVEVTMNMATQPPRRRSMRQRTFVDVIMIGIVDIIRMIIESDHFHYFIAIFHQAFCLSLAIITVTTSFFRISPDTS